MRVARAVLAGAALLCLAGVAAAGAPRRVVSMNLCTDQLAMMLAAPGQLISVSDVALDRRVSPLADKAATYRINHGGAEEIYLMHPDLVAAGIYTPRDTIALLRGLGIEVVQFDIAESLDDVRKRLSEMGAALGQERAASALVAQFDEGLAALRADANGAPGPDAPRAALYYANGYTSGSQSLAGDILATAGLRNAPAEAGFAWGKLPLEMLAMLQPDLVVTARRYPGGSRAEEIMDHPVVRALKGAASGATLTDQDWICGTPFVLRAIADMSAARRAAAGAE